MINLLIKIKKLMQELAPPGPYPFVAQAESMRQLQIAAAKHRQAIHDAQEKIISRPILPVRGMETKKKSRRAMASSFSSPTSPPDDNRYFGLTWTAGPSQTLKAYFQNPKIPQNVSYS